MLQAKKPYQRPNNFWVKKFGEKDKRAGKIKILQKKNFTKKIVYTHFLNDTKKVWSFNLAGNTAMLGKHKLHMAPKLLSNLFLMNANALVIF